MDTQDEPTYQTLSRLALHWGVYTWVGNGVGCLLGIVPLALPLSVISTIVTLFTGIAAMVWGVRGRRGAKQAGDDKAARDAVVGFVLGLAHVGAVILMGLAVAGAMNLDSLGLSRAVGY